jgi:hypothetical protein
MIDLHRRPRIRISRRVTRVGERPGPVRCDSRLLQGRHLLADHPGHREAQELPRRDDPDQLEQDRPDGAIGSAGLEAGYVGYGGNIDTPTTGVMG